MLGHKQKGFEKFCHWKILGPEKIVGPKKFLIPQNIWYKIILVDWLE